MLELRHLRMLDAGLLVGRQNVIVVADPTSLTELLAKVVLRQLEAVIARLADDRRLAHDSFMHAVVVAVSSVTLRRQSTLVALSEANL